MTSSTPTAATRIDGKVIGGEIRERIAREVSALQREHGVTPGLAVVLVGGDEASQVYVSHKRKASLAAGMESFEHFLDEDTSQADLLALIERLNRDPAVNGILVQLPLPAQISEDAVLAAIDPDKDVDGFHEINTGRLWNGGNPPVPCTALGCVLLLQHTLGNDLAGRHAVIVGRSNIVGKPLANLLLRENCTVTVAHSKTRDLPGLCRQADILVAAVGRPKFVQGDWIKPGATVIDVGINRLEANADGKRRLVGDVDYAAAAEVAGAITPVPGGVGPMTIACLLHNTVRATCQQKGLPLPAGD